jgi:hypothetical protein
MGRLQLSIVLSLCGLMISIETGASPLAAEWVKVGGTHKYDQYVDMRTIGMAGPQATLWTLRDFRIERAFPGGPYRSIRMKRQYDCHQKRSRPLWIRYYQQPMGQGPMLYAAQATREWSRVIPGSDDDTEMKIACRSALGSRRPRG